MLPIYITLTSYNSSSGWFDVYLVVRSGKTDSIQKLYVDLNITSTIKCYIFNVKIDNTSNHIKKWSVIFQFT